MKKRKLMSALLAAGLILGGTPCQVRAASFEDVKDTAWYSKAVEYVSGQGLMNGTSGVTFSPDGITTRGMIVTVLHNLEGRPVGTGVSFQDVEAGRYYADAVAWAAAKGIVGGYSQSRFGPEDPVTREQLAAILMRYLEYKGEDVSASGDLAVFPDRDKLSGYAVKAMSWAVGAGLVSGLGDGTLAPGGQATRAQVATILARMNGAETGPIVTPQPEPVPPAADYSLYLPQLQKRMADPMRSEFCDNLAQLYDLDGDGVRELILLTSTYIESFVSVYDLEGGAAVPRMEDVSLVVLAGSPHAWVDVVTWQGGTYLMTTVDNGGTDENADRTVDTVVYEGAGLTPVIRASMDYHGWIKENADGWTCNGQSCTKAQYDQTIAGLAKVPGTCMELYGDGAQTLEQLAEQLGGLN